MSGVIRPVTYRKGSYKANVGVIGNPSVGKTTLIKTIQEGKHEKGTLVPTINTERYAVELLQQVNERTLQVTRARPAKFNRMQKLDPKDDDSDITVGFWDSAGDQAFRDMTTVSFNLYDGVMMCFDLGNMLTLIDLIDLFDPLCQKSKRKETKNGITRNRVPIFLVGCKEDVRDTKVKQYLRDDESITGLEYMTQWLGSSDDTQDVTDALVADIQAFNDADRMGKIALIRKASHVKIKPRQTETDIMLPLMWSPYISTTLGVENSNSPVRKAIQSARVAFWEFWVGKWRDRRFSEANKTAANYLSGMPVLPGMLESFMEDFVNAPSSADRNSPKTLTAMDICSYRAFVRACGTVSSYTNVEGIERFIGGTVLPELELTDETPRLPNITIGGEARSRTIRLTTESQVRKGGKGKCAC